MPENYLVDVLREAEPPRNHRLERLVGDTLIMVAVVTCMVAGFMLASQGRYWPAAGFLVCAPLIVFGFGRIE